MTPQRTASVLEVKSKRRDAAAEEEEEEEEFEEEVEEVILCLYPLELRLKLWKLKIYRLKLKSVYTTDWLNDWMNEWMNA